MSFLRRDMTQVVEILPQVRQELICSTRSISRLLMCWRHKEPGHQQPWYLLRWTVLIRSPHINSLRPSDAYVRQKTNHHWFRYGLSPGRRQAIIWTYAGILLIRTLGTNFGEILSEIRGVRFHSRKCIWKWGLRNGVHFVSASMC